MLPPLILQILVYATARTTNGSKYEFLRRISILGKCNTKLPSPISMDEFSSVRRNTQIITPKQFDL